MRCQRHLSLANAGLMSHSKASECRFEKVLNFGIWFILRWIFGLQSKLVCFFLYLCPEKALFFLLTSLFLDIFLLILFKIDCLSFILLVFLPIMIGLTISWLKIRLKSYTTEFSPFIIFLLDHNLFILLLDFLHHKIFQSGRLKLILFYFLEFFLL